MSGGRALGISAKEQEAVNVVLDRQSFSDDRFQGQNEKLRKLNRYFLSLSPKQEGSENDIDAQTEAGRGPDLFVPLFWALVQQAVPQWVFQAFSSKPALKVYGRTPEDQEHAESIEKMTDYNFDLAQVKSRAAVDLGYSTCKFGTGIWKVGWRYDEYQLVEEWERDPESGLNVEPGVEELVQSILRKSFKKRKKVVRYDGVTLDHVSLFRFKPDPLYPDIRDMRYVTETYYTDLATLEWEDKQFANLTGRKRYKNLSKIPKFHEVERNIYEDHGDAEVAEAMGWSKGSHSGNKYTGSRGHRSWGGANASTQFDRNPEYREIVRIDEYWATDHEVSGDRLILIANRSVPIYDGPNPWADKELPYGAVRCFRLENQFYGMGILHPNEVLQEELNSHRNLWMRNVQLSTNNVWAVGEDEDVPTNLAYLDPGETVQTSFTDSGKPLMTPLYQAKPTPPSALALEDRIVADAQRAVGSNAMIEPTSDTATEAELMRAGAAVRERLQAMLAEEEFVVPVAKKFLSRERQFFNGQKIVRVLGKHAAEFITITEEDIHGEYDFIPTGAISKVSPAVMRTQFETAIALRGRDPELLEVTDPYELYLELMKTFDGIQNPERFMRKPPERTLSPEQENPALLAGIWIPPEIHDDHQAHMEAHMAALMEMAEGGEMDTNAMANVEKHVQQHQKFADMLQAQSVPQQEQPDVGSEGGPGAEVANPNNAVPTEGGIQAKVRG